jgi:hypothetical protein
MNTSDHMRDTGLSRKIILKWIIKKYGVKLWAG